MINLKFFPSRRIAWYMVRLFLTRSLAVLIALVLVLMTLDLLGDPESLAEIREADAAYARGDVVRGVEAVRALRP